MSNITKHIKHAETHIPDIKHLRNIKTYQTLPHHANISNMPKHKHIQTFQTYQHIQHNKNIRDGKHIKHIKTYQQYRNIQNNKNKTNSTIEHASTHHIKQQTYRT